MDKKFSIEFCSDLDYEEMVADIYYEGHAIGMLTQENGTENMKIKLYQISVEVLEMPLDGYLETIVDAKNQLIKRNTVQD